MKTILIAAIARGGVIGRTTKPCGNCDGVVVGSGPCVACSDSGRVPANNLPWPPGWYSEHDALIERETADNAAIMGRRAWESLLKERRPLKGRTNIVVTTTPMCIDAAMDFPSLQEAIDALRYYGHRSDLYVIGGAQLYAAALPIADELVLTLIDQEWPGDVVFPRGDVFFAHGLGSTIALENIGAFEYIERTTRNDPDLTFTRWARR